MIHNLATARDSPDQVPSKGRRARVAFAVLLYLLQVLAAAVVFAGVNVGTAILWVLLMGPSGPATLGGGQPTTPTHAAPVELHPAAPSPAPPTVPHQAADVLLHRRS